jgi:hypothetical protein
MSMWLYFNEKRTYLVIATIGFCLIVFINSCEKEIPIDFPSYSKQLVVEGMIEQDKGPMVLLSFSAPFFTQIDSANIRDYIALRAKITVSTKTDSFVLTLRPNDVYFPPYYYFSSDLSGKLNSQYSLKVEYSGHTFISTTTIPDIVYPDSVWFAKEINQDSLGLLWIRINDNPLEENFYQTLIKRKGKDKRFIPTLISVFDDKMFNGEKMQISLSRGSANMLEVGTNRFFAVGDTLILKFCSIDRTTFDFWHSLQGSIITSANPFSANALDVQSNIKNGLGIWGGYAAVYDTIIAK